MKNILIIAVLVLGFVYLKGNDKSETNLIVEMDSAGITQSVAVQTPTNNPPVPTATFGRAQSGNQIQGSGQVVRVLSDDNDGSRHQRFIIRLPSGQTLLVAHNIDIAPRINGIAVNDSVEFDGEYEWNSQGGVVHWTHHDPNSLHKEGSLSHNGRVYK